MPDRENRVFVASYSQTDFLPEERKRKGSGQMRKAAASAVERRRQAQGRRVVTAGLRGLRGISEGRPPAGGGAGAGTAALPNR